MRASHSCIAEAVSCQVAGPATVSSGHLSHAAKKKVAAPHGKHHDPPPRVKRDDDPDQFPEDLSKNGVYHGISQMIHLLMIMFHTEIAILRTFERCLMFRHGNIVQSCCLNHIFKMRSP